MTSNDKAFTIAILTVIFLIFGFLFYVQYSEDQVIKKAMEEGYIQKVIPATNNFRSYERVIWVKE